YTCCHNLSCCDMAESQGFSTRRNVSTPLWPARRRSVPDIVITSTPDGPPRSLVLQRITRCVSTRRISVSLSSPVSTVAIPRMGMLATVRNRRALIRTVEPFDGGLDGRVHLVTLEYLDADGVGEDVLVWEREPGARVLEPTALPHPGGTPPMPPDEFDAFVRATRWTALFPYISPAHDTTPPAHVPLAAPFHGAIQVEDFQLVPLLKALRMPRVALLLADDVGLGKTIEAGLILSELMLRRRVRRVLIVCPASLRSQWQQEMRDKFSLLFDELDRR